MIKRIKHAIGEIETTTIKAVVLALATFYFPLAVGTCWLLIAFVVQFGIWDKLALFFYQNTLLAGKPGAALGHEMLKTVKKE
ncbi:MAG: hypothetical protein WC766_06185, partial [Patescibacteria group bacterium]